MDTKISVVRFFAVMFVVSIVALAVIGERLTPPVLAQGPVTIHGVKLEATQSGRVNIGEVARDEALQQETNYRSRAVPFNEQVEQSNPAIGLSQSEPSAPIALSAVSLGPSTIYQGLDDISDGSYHYTPLTRWARVSPRGFFSLYLTSMNWLDEG